MSAESSAPCLADTVLADARWRAQQFRQRAHPRCVVCSDANPLGLNIEYKVNPDGGVSAAFGCHSLFEGYPGLLHGGVIATLLDGAMTNCLFAQGVQAVTGKLNIRYLHPVRTGVPVELRAWVESSTALAHETQSQLWQEGRLMCTASALFIPYAEDSRPPG